MKIETDYYRIQALGNILVVTSFYAWDEKTASAFAGNVKEVILENFQARKWALLNDGREWELGTLDIEPVIHKLMTSPLTGNLTHHAFVTGPSEMKKWQTERLQ